MMEKKDLIFTVKPFTVWHGDQAGASIGSALIRIEYGTHSWGHCRSKTCAHNSHDPFMKGDTIFILCREIGKDAHQNMLYLLEDGRLLTYNTKSPGFHFAPHNAIEFTQLKS